MKALGKVFDTQVITGIIGDKFHFDEAKENLLIWRRKENRQERRYQRLQSLQKKTQQFIKGEKLDGALNVYQVTSYIVNWFWKLTVKF